MKYTYFLIVAISFTFLAHSVSAQTPAEKERSTFITNAKLLEKKPFDPMAETVRSSAFKWLIETDQVSVSLCGSLMKLVPEKKNKFKGELTMQLTFGMAIFKLENPGKKDDERAASLAGIESVLRTYEVMLAANEKAKNAELDALVAKQKAGELKAVIDAAFDKGDCSSDKSK